MMVNIQIIMYQTTLYDIFFIDMIKRHKKGYNLQLSNSFVLSTLESYKLVGAYFHGLAIIQDSMECNLGISLMAIMKMIMFHYSYICNSYDKFVGEKSVPIMPMESTKIDPRTMHKFESFLQYLYLQN